MEKKITILGDILFSRVARSNLWGLSKLGAEVTFVGPSTLVPKTFEKLGAKVSHDIEKSLGEADAVMLEFSTRDKVHLIFPLSKSILESLG